MAMKLQIRLLALLTLLPTVVPLVPNFPALLTTPQVLAQTSTDRKAEADRLKKQGIEQYQTSQFEAALQSWQQALAIYREIKDRQGEWKALNNLGNAYYSLGDYAKAIDYRQQSLAIANYLGDYAKAIEYYQQSLAIALFI